MRSLIRSRRTRTHRESLALACLFFANVAAYADTGGDGDVGGEGRRGGRYPIDMIIDEPGDEVELSCDEQDDPAVLLQWRIFMPRGASDRFLDWQVHIAHGRSTGT